MKHLLTFQDMIDSPCKLVSEDSQGLCLAVLSCQFLSILDCFGVSPEKQDGSFREGPFQVGVADLFSRGANDLACRFLCTFDESAVGDEVLYSGKPVNVVDLIENSEAEDSSDARNGTEAKIRIGVMDFCDKREFMFEMV